MSELKESILELEIRHSAEGKLLKQELLETYENLKPLNLIKNGFKDLTSSPDFKNDILGAAVGITTGIISKAIVVGVSHNPLKKIAGSLLQFGITSAVSKHPETIKLMVSSIVSFFKNKKEPEIEMEKEIFVRVKQPLEYSEGI